MVDSECGDFPLELNSRQTWSKCWSDHFRAIPNAKSLSDGIQTMLLKVLAHLLNDIDKVILLDIPVFENKGDPAIALGEFNLMRMLHKEVIYTCTYQCASKQWQPTRDMMDTLSSDNVLAQYEAVSDIGPFRFPDNVTFIERDWDGHWPTPRGETLMDQLHLFPFNGLLYLQRGPVLITDRLHGYIISSLFDNFPIVLYWEIHLKKCEIFTLLGDLHTARSSLVPPTKLQSKRLTCSVGFTRTV
ncbi:hypothetical protein CAPTEDRAFT_217243 [Capitella teleta]|uniref:Polysaccharide pyruvyl transferase domain-containing protein n=1 Tax=Capitella teleta TaxID=283909 RepID=R7TBM4_CAPTE|nr:hypothetical protein CAPTEDRAFT_217243 [Capitella teleta]|eukprot:ELT90872.1 hypothetical protein CAPTEDRAFT_217243 [Capitella teleta]